MRMSQLMLLFHLFVQKLLPKVSPRTRWHHYYFTTSLPRTFLSIRCNSFGVLSFTLHPSSRFWRVNIFLQLSVFNQFLLVPCDVFCFFLIGSLITYLSKQSKVGWDFSNCRKEASNNSCNSGIGPFHPRY